MSEAALVSELNQVELVVVDTNKFKIKLGIGEDAYASLKTVKTLQTIWDVKEAAGAGAVAAASPAVATTFFGGGGGILSALGFGAAAATPVGWIIAAAVVSGGAYYGAMRVASSYTSSRVDTIPKFINTPIDLLGATIFDLMAGLALKVAEFAGEVDDEERTAIIDYFFDEWGVSREFSEKAIPLIEQQVTGRTLKDLAKSLADFQIDNPDCNPNSMKQDIRKFLEEIAFADGEFDEREELAIETIERELGQHLSVQSQTMKAAKKHMGTATQAVSGLSSAVQNTASGVFGSIMSRIKK